MFCFHLLLNYDCLSCEKCKIYHSFISWSFTYCEILYSLLRDNKTDNCSNVILQPTIYIIYLNCGRAKNVSSPSSKVLSCIILNKILTYILWPEPFYGRARVLFALFVFTCMKWCPIHIVLCFYFVFLRLVCHVLSFSLDCPFWVASFTIYTLLN